MSVNPLFEKWAKGFSGCDGGNLNGVGWFCGIEWGTGKDHEISKELTEDVSKPPQIYQTPDDALLNAATGVSYPYGVKLIKLITAMRGGSVSDYKRVAKETPFPFHRDSDFFKLNLFPIAFRNKEARRLWAEKISALTGLPTTGAYLQWCREHRFPQMRSWVEKGKPKLIVGIGAGREHKPDLKEAFGFTGARENEETVEGKKLLWMANGKIVLAIIPFLGYQNGLLNTDQLVQAFGERLGLFAGLRNSHEIEPSSRFSDVTASRRSSRQFRIPRDQPTRTSLTAEDGWNHTYSNPQIGKQTDYIERALSDAPRTADELAIIANLIARRDAFVRPSRVTEHLYYHHLTLGAEERARRGDNKLRMPYLIHSNGRWSMPNEMRQN